jgi:crotonobetainyl-CoA:carnitine CoA-transferase CaiB-like acyl-CoA transferase
MRLVGRVDLVAEPWFSTGAGRAEHVDVIDEAVATWIAARSCENVLAAFASAEAAIAPVYDAADIVSDPQLRAIGALREIDDDELGRITMTNVVPRLSGTPGKIVRAGGSHGRDTEAVLSEIGVDSVELERLRAEGVV